MSLLGPLRPPSVAPLWQAEFEPELPQPRAVANASALPCNPAGFL